MSIKTQGFLLFFTMVYTATKLINIPSTTHNKDTYIIAFIFFVLCYSLKTIINIILCQAIQQDVLLSTDSLYIGYILQLLLQLPS